MNPATFAVEPKKESISELSYETLSVLDTICGDLAAIMGTLVGENMAPGENVKSIAEPHNLLDNVARNRAMAENIRETVKRLKDII